MANFRVRFAAMFSDLLGCAGRLVGFVAFPVAVFLVWAIPDWGFLKSEITQYEAQCSVPLVEGRCDGVKFTLNPTTYRVIPENQTVVYQVGDMPPSKVTKCAILNRRNWTCTFNDDSAKFGFTNGNYFNTSLKPSIFEDLYKKRYPLSRLRYLRLKFLGS